VFTGAVVLGGVRADELFADRDLDGVADDGDRDWSPVVIPTPIPSVPFSIGTRSGLAPAPTVGTFHGASLGRGFEAKSSLPRGVY
jgi:hypothetical protein